MSTTVGPGRLRPLGDFGVASNGEYGIPKDVIFGVPVTCANGEYQRVEGLPIDAFSQECIDKTLAELIEEQDGVKHLL